jgi:hypothetical protein
MRRQLASAALFAVAATPVHQAVFLAMLEYSGVATCLGGRGLAIDAPIFLGANWGPLQRRYMQN